VKFKCCFSIHWSMTVLLSVASSHALIPTWLLAELVSCSFRNNSCWCIAGTVVHSSKMCHDAFTWNYSMVQKIWHFFLDTLTLSNINHQMLTDFINCFTARIRRKFAIIPSLKIPPHLKCVATLLCDMLLSGASCHSVSLIMPLVSGIEAWMHCPTALWKHWTFDVKIAGCDSYFRQ